MLFATFCDGADVMRLGQWPPDASRRFWRRELSLGRDSARAVRTRDRFVVCGAAHRTVRFCEVHCDELSRMQMGFVWPSGPVPCVK